jgi:imidazoleglycerol-phosphate dehydratase
MGEIRRIAERQRATKETDVRIKLDLDGKGEPEIDTGIGFLDHMLTLFAVHSRVNLSVQAQGDLEVDDHHTVEDIGICLGQAIQAALQDKAGIHRYGEATLPMDESLVRVVLDLSGRPYFVYQVDIPAERLGTLATENVKEFFQAVVNQSGMTLHIDLLRGQNAHHIVEAVFKAFAHAFAQAIAFQPGLEGILSSKGTL